jgi:two-component system response regulator DevR
LTRGCRDSRPSTAPARSSTPGGSRGSEDRSLRIHRVVAGSMRVSDDPDETSLRVFLVDAEDVVRRGVASVLESDPGITVVGEARNTAEALARIPALRPHVALLDVRLPDGDGAEVCRSLRRRMPELKVVMLTSWDGDRELAASMTAGAAGYLRKDISGADLVAAVRTVAGGGLLLDRAAAAAALERTQRVSVPAAELAELTARDRTLLDLIGRGLANRAIGERMGLAEKTVKNNVSQLLGKLGLDRRTQAAVLATELRSRPAPLAAAEIPGPPGPPIWDDVAGSYRSGAPR